MSRTLVVCNNEFLRTLYTMNLEVYLATSVVIVTSAESAIATYKAQKDFNLIITLDIIDKKNAFKEIEEYRGSYGIKTPVMKIGADKDEDIDNKTFAIASRYDIQAILKKAASILGVTAKQMSEMQVGAYYPMSTSAMTGLTKAPCNLYVKIENQHKIIIWGNDPISDELKLLQDSGTNTIYVKSSDRLVVVNNASLRIIERISGGLHDTKGKSIEEKLDLLSDGFEIAAANLFSTEDVKNEMVGIANAASKVMTDVAKDSAQLKALVATMLNNRTGYIFTHTIVTSYVANYLMKNVTWGGEKSSADKINFVLFFHDIYLAPIYLRHPQLKYEKSLANNLLLTEKENQTVMNHARMAAELVVGYKRCPMGADLLIKHHHGMKKGNGFANRYAEDLAVISKVLLVAEAFTERFLECIEKKEKVQMKEILPKLVFEFSSESFTTIIKTLVDIPI